MNCITCDRPAHGLCRFCGRAVCRDHIKTMPFILSLFRAEDGTPQALIPPDAVYCGTCQPRGRPVSLEGLDGGKATSKSQP